MNKPIRSVSIFCLLLFVALMLNVTYLQFWQADSLNDRAENRRVKEAAYSSERGAILVGRTPIAESKPVDDEFNYLRTYPAKGLYAPVTGYFSFGSSSGIESSQNEVLSGDDPRLFIGSLVDLLSNKAPKGGNVQLTLDPDAQQAAYDGLAALGDDVEGSVVALQPSTGKILAMVSLPTFDPNRLASHDFATRDALYARLLEDDQDPLLNRAIQTRLFPGSVFKLVTAAAALESDKYDGPDAMVPGGSTFQLPQTSGEGGLIDNEGRYCGSGEITLRLAMEQSCNTTFAQLAIEVGAEGMLRQAEQFGFNSSYLEDLGGQVRSSFPDELTPPEVGQVGFGQFEVQATPLQMAMVAAAIANDGVVMRPYVVDEVQSADYDAQTTDPEELSRAISEETAETLREVMVSTVDDGTASPAAISGVSVGGKTGTAQRGVPGQPPYGWFVSFAPQDDADVAVAVMIQEAPGREIAGGALGGPIAKAVMEAIIR
ncbi:penicillin-binding protein 2 [Nocardioides dongxiaopingii]|jgi:peptidoglycan glycosyltransferase|uniref:peptidoglycan D,D-transpeptidase FtsI family protein n=1 Tax=Nocardioides sp. S-1144 TaxID=2582905 RepID=UPI00110D53A9|nr:penicillin-binding protein 2 [Nocardioides sp. S-1144]QCW49218.1 penicillin-binding protein 2 [Nocardioides sp. S-1144]